jgi:hypothetical protein
MYDMRHIMHLIRIRISGSGTRSGAPRHLYPKKDPDIWIRNRIRRPRHLYPKKDPDIWIRNQIRRPATSLSKEGSGTRSGDPRHLYTKKNPDGWIRNRIRQPQHLYPKKDPDIWIRNKIRRPPDIFILRRSGYLDPEPDQAPPTSLSGVFVALYMV